jgi:succinoglycan biosynthesis transport protein ExoP
VQLGPNRSNLERALGVARRRWFWMPLCLVLGAGAAFGISKSQTKKYTATASLIFKSNQFSQEIAGLGLQDVTSPQAEQSNNLKLVEFGDMAERTASILGGGVTPQQVSESLTIAEQGESTATGEASIVDVSASTGSPSLAVQIANTYVRQFVKRQQTSSSHYFKSALALVNKQLAAIPPPQRFSTAAVDLQNRADSLRLLAELQYDGVEFSRPAVTPSSPSSPRTKRSTIIGGALGLVIGVGLISLLEHLDRRIREPEDLERIYGAPLLGIVRKSASLSTFAHSEGSALGALPPSDVEAFSMILAHLRSRNHDRQVRTVLIASAAPGDGKTTVALNLADAAARTGADVLLLEINFRHPGLASRLGIQSRPSLGDVLIDNIPVGDATQRVAVTGLSEYATTSRTFDVITSGNVHLLSPSELIESDAMESLLERATSDYDLVIIDTPSLTAVADAIPLLPKVDGIVIVGSIGHSRSDVAERLRQALDSSGALLGVVANRFKSGTPSFPGYDSLDGKDSSAAGDAPSIGSAPEPRSTATT